MHACTVYLHRQQPCHERSRSQSSILKRTHTQRMHMLLLGLPASRARFIWTSAGSIVDEIEEALSHRLGASASAGQSVVSEDMLAATRSSGQAVQSGSTVATEGYTEEFEAAGPSILPATRRPPLRGEYLAAGHATVFAFFLVCLTRVCHGHVASISIGTCDFGQNSSLRVNCCPCCGLRRAWQRRRPQHHLWHGRG